MPSNLVLRDTAKRYIRLFEDDAHSVVDIRTDSLPTLRELGPPDLVHLVKQPVKSSNRQVRYNPFLSLCAEARARIAVKCAP